MNMTQILLKNCKKVLTADSSRGGEIGELKDFSILIEDSKISKIAPYEALKPYVKDDAKIIDCEEKTVLPGFVDPHTHLVFGGDRLEEYVARLTTNNIEEIKRRAGLVGLASSIAQTKEAGFDGLMESSLDKLNNMLLNGITTVEIKSGYGIDKETELEQLRVVKELKNIVPQTLIATYLGGHYWDEEMGKDQYIDFMINEVLPEVVAENLAERIDIWTDDGFYDAEETRKVLQAGIDLGLEATVHTDGYSAIGGAKVAAELGARSGDHLNYVPDDEVAMMIEKDVVGIVLPGTDYSVNHPHPVDARHLIDKGLTVALATNLNPGNYSISLQFIMDLACRRHGMTPEEALLGTTIYAAKALGLEDKYGSLEEGKVADIQIWDTDDYRNAIYRHGMNFVETVIKDGKIVVEDKKIIYGGN